MKSMLTATLLIGTCVGCYSLPLWTPSCTHTNQAVHEFKNFSDGHHYLFGKDSKLVASINTKDSFLAGKFEVYYRTGILKYWGMLDDRGHVVSGSYNTYELRLDDYNIRSMTVADKQNAQTELVNIMLNGHVKERDAIHTRTPVGIDVSDGSANANIKSNPPRAKCLAPSLFDCTCSTFSPKVGGVYEHDGRRLKVFQAIEGGVLVCKELDFDSSDFKDVLLHSMDVFIETSKGYVDNEMLASGQYEYVGPLTYETVEKQTRTIRRFKQVQ